MNFRIDGISKYLFEHIGKIKNQIKSKYWTNIVWMFTDKGVKLISELAVGLIIARYLGAELFGLLSFAISFVTIAYGISTLGLSELITRELINFKFHHNKILGTALTLRIFAGLVFTVLVNLAALLMSLEFETRLLVFIVSSSILWKSFDLIQFHFQAEIDSVKTAKVRIYSSVFFSIAKIFLVVQHQSVYYFALLYALEWLANAVGFCYFYSLNESIFQWRFSKRMASVLLRNSWYLIISGLAVDLYMRVDQIMIRQTLGDAANGYYSVAARISELWYTIPSILCSVLFPALLNAKRTNQALFDSRTLSLLSVMFWSSLSIAALITPFSKTIIVYLYTTEYIQASEVLSIHIWSGIFVFWGVGTSYWLLSENSQYISLTRTLIGLLVNIILNYFLIPIYGINGAAMATLVSQAIASSFSLLLFKKTRKLFVMQLTSIVYPFLVLKSKIENHENPS